MSLVTRGDFTETANAVATTLTIAPGTGGDNSTTVTDIDVKGAVEISVQVTNGTPNALTGVPVGGLSTSVDVFFYGNNSATGTGYTQIPIGLMNLGSNSSDMWFGSRGFYKLKMVITNNDTTTGNVAPIFYKVVVKK